MSNGLHPARLDKMRAIMRAHVTSGGVPGYALCIARRGEVVVDVAGVAVDGGDRAVARDTIFRISSMTKPITAIAALILVDECRLRLDDPIDRVIPELANRRVIKSITGPLDDTVAAHRPITTRDLLTFVGGYGLVLHAPGRSTWVETFFGPEINQGPPHPGRMPAPDEWLRRLAKLPLACQPGAQWLYNTGSDILGVLIERVAGASLASFMRERVFEPLGMRDTSFHVPPEKLDRFTTCTATSMTTRKPELYDVVDGEWSKEPAFALGGAGLVSTIDDYLAFARMLSGGGTVGKTRIVSRAAVEMMTSDQLTPSTKHASGALTPGFFDDNGWGFGVSVATRRAQPWSVGTYGWNGGLGSWWHNDPREDMTLVLMTNRAWDSPSPPVSMRDFCTAAYAAIDD